MNILREFDAIIAALTKRQYKLYVEAYYGKRNMLPDISVIERNLDDYFDFCDSIKDIEELIYDLSFDSADNSTGEEMFQLALIDFNREWKQRHTPSEYDKEKFKNEFWQFFLDRYEQEKSKPVKPTKDLQRLYDSLFGKKDRIIIPLGVVESIIDDSDKTIYGMRIDILLKTVFHYTNKEEESKYIQDMMDEGTPDMRDYSNGFYEMRTSPGRKLRIGKLLNIAKKLISNGTIPEDELRMFDVVEMEKEYLRLSENKPKELIAVISRHPYDIAGMSTGRGWRSCMNLVDGEYRDFVGTTIMGGGLVAYICYPNDTTDLIDSNGVHHKNNKINIQHPLGRVLIKPYFKSEVNPDLSDRDFLLICSEQYGTFNPAAIQELQHWIDEHWNKFKSTGTFYRSRNFYHEELDSDSIYR